MIAKMTPVEQRARPWGPWKPRGLGDMFLRLVDEPTPNDGEPTRTCHCTSPYQATDSPTAECVRPKPESLPHP